MFELLSDFFVFSGKIYKNRTAKVLWTWTLIFRGVGKHNKKRRNLTHLLEQYQTRSLHEQINNWGGKISWNPTKN